MALNANYQDVSVNLNVGEPSNKIRGVIPNYNTVSIGALRVQLNPSSTQDFFASGEFLKQVAVTNGVIIADLVSAIDDDCIGVLENTDKLQQEEKIANGAVIKRYEKGDYVNISTSFNGTVIMQIETAEAITINSAVEIATTGDQVQNLTTGKKVGVAMDSSSGAGETIRVRLEKF